LKEQEARFIFMQLVAALEYIHSKGVVHRDLKPENILVDSKSAARPIVKITDFGQSKFFNNSTPMTQCGTPRYWAPEISDSRLCKEGYGSAVDLWSLGVVLFVMLEGRLPFEGDAAHMADRFNRATVSWPPTSKTSAAARDIVGKLLQSAPSNRLPLADCKKHPWYVSTNSITPPLALSDDDTEFIPCPGPPKDPKKIQQGHPMVRTQETNTDQLDQVRPAR